MTDPSAPRPAWQPTPGWYLKRIVATVAPLFLIGYWIADATGHAEWPGWSVLVVFGIGIPLTIAAFIRGRRTNRSRHERVQALAAEQGWSFFPADPRFTTRWSTSPFGAGTGRRAYDVVIGTHQGWASAAFTYRYTTGSGDNQSTTVLGVTTLMLPARLPPITVTPESLVGEITPGITRADIDVESETFNRRYRVRTRYPKYASDVLPPRTIEALLSVEPFSWRIDGCDLVAWGEPTSDMAGVLARLDVLATIAGNIPQFVWKDVARPV